MSRSSSNYLQKLSYGYSTYCRTHTPQIKQIYLEMATVVRRALCCFIYERNGQHQNQPNTKFKNSTKKYFQYYFLSVITNRKL